MKTCILALLFYELYSDGTFYACSSQFQQMYTIHANIDDQMYPLLLALLPGKIQAVYTQLLTKFKTSMADLQLFMNFETAAHSATRTVFPGITVKGCFFHYTQAIWRITQHTGLQVTYRNNDIRQLVRRAAVTTLIDGFNRRRLFQCSK